MYSVLSSSGASAAYAADILAIMDLYFYMPLGPIPSIVLLLTTQCIGFGLAGMSFHYPVDQRYASEPFGKSASNVLALHAGDCETFHDALPNLVLLDRPLEVFDPDSHSK
jgi:hypothetical protein